MSNIEIKNIMFFLEKKINYFLVSQIKVLRDQK